MFLGFSFQLLSFNPVALLFPTFPFEMWDRGILTFRLRCLVHLLVLHESNVNDQSCMYGLKGESGAGSGSSTYHVHSGLLLSVR